VLTGQNPYLAYAERASLPGPVWHIGGAVVAADQVVQPGLGLIPANTAPLLVMLTPLASFSWPDAKTIWLVCNLALLVILPWLVLRLLPAEWTLTWQERWLVVLVFMSMKGPREAIASGQTSLLVFGLMLLALLLRGRWWAGGLLLGLALSKYSLALPVFIYLCMERRFRLVATAVAVQVIGLGVVSLLGDSSFADTFGVYRAIFLLHAPQGGIHWATVLPAPAPLPSVITILLSLATAGVLGWWWMQPRLGDKHLLLVNAALAIWTLLVAYHRNYDTFLVILFFAYVMGILTVRVLTPRQALGMSLFTLGAIAVMCLPGDIMRVFLTQEQSDLFLVWVDRALTWTLTAMLVVALWLLWLTSKVRMVASRSTVDLPTTTIYDTTIAPKP
jgi:hypothetical protein